MVAGVWCHTPTISAFGFSLTCRSRSPMCMWSQLMPAIRHFLAIGSLRKGKGCGRSGDEDLVQLVVGDAARLHLPGEVGEQVRKSGVAAVAAPIAAAGGVHAEHEL